MANINFTNKKGLIEHGFKDVALRQKKDSDYWLKFKKGKNLKLYWKMRSDDQEIIKETAVKDDAYIIELDEIDIELAKRAGFDSIEDLKGHLEEKYGDDYEEHEYVVISWED